MDSVVHFQNFKMSSGNQSALLEMEWDDLLSISCSKSHFIMSRCPWLPALLHTFWYPRETLVYEATALSQNAHQQAVLPSFHSQKGICFTFIRCNTGRFPTVYKLVDKWWHECNPLVRHLEWIRVPMPQEPDNSTAGDQGNVAAIRKFLETWDSRNHSTVQQIGRWVDRR